MQDIGIDHVVLALHAQPGPFFDHRARGQLQVSLRADQHSTDGSQTLETRAGIDRIAHGGVGDMAVASYFANDHSAAVDTNAHPGPIWMSLGQASNPALKCQGSTRCSLRMIGLVSFAVERGHDSVSGELL